MKKRETGVSDSKTKKRQGASRPQDCRLLIAFDDFLLFWVVFDCFWNLFP